MKLSRLMFLTVSMGALTVLGCGGSGGDGGAGEGGNGGTAGSGGTAGGGGTAGSGGSGAFAITPGLWSTGPRATSVCLFVNETGDALVADESCNQSGPDFWAFEFRTNRQPPSICAFGYPLEGEVPQDVPIVDNKFDIEQIRGDITIKFSGEFTGGDTVGGVASSTMNCPADERWSAKPGCCSGCAWCQ